MYCRHFHLHKKPFQISSDNDFLWLGKAHKTALALLKKGMEDEQSLLILTGDIGTGKTTLLNEIIQTLDTDIGYVRIEDPGLELHSLFQRIAQGFGFENKRQEKFSDGFFSFLKETERAGRKVLVILDESQRIPGRFLMEMISWSQFHLPHVLTVILAGQLEMLEVFRRHLGREWPDHVHASLRPLSLEESRAYIARRLEVAGATQRIFLPAAVEEIYTYAKGIPRLINIACDQALIQAFADDKTTIDTAAVQKAILPLELPGTVKAEDLPDPRKTRKKEEADRGRAMNFSDSDLPKKPGGRKKTAAVLAAACICIFAGYWFYKNPVLVGKKPIVVWPETDPDLIREDPAKGKKSLGSEAIVRPEIRDPESSEQNFMPGSPPAFPAGDKPSPGLGYTPEPETVDSESMNPGRETARQKTHELSAGPEPIQPIPPPLGETKSLPSRDLDSLIRDVFLSEEKKTNFIGSGGGYPERKMVAGENRESEILSEDRPLPSPESRENPLLMDPEPEPDAIIDWLLKKKAAKKASP